MREKNPLFSAFTPPLYIYIYIFEDNWMMDISRYIIIMGENYLRVLEIVFRDSSPILLLSY